MDSILLTIKKMLGLDAEYTPFDTDVMVDINTVLMTLNQLGVGPKQPYVITGPEETWGDFTSRKDLEAIKTFIYLRVKLLFDPPANSYTIEALERQAAEYEWRLNAQAERKEVDPSG